MDRLSPLPLSAIALLSFGCATSIEAPPVESGDARDASFLTGRMGEVPDEGKLDGAALPTAAEREALLQLVNTASYEVLDFDVALDRRAAEHIVVHRWGRDGVAGTRDDDPIETLAELDAVPWVGPSAFARLLTYVRALGLAESAPCLIISEYIEGSEDRNKFMELYNCSERPLQLDDYGVCIVRNDDSTCSLAAPLDDGVLAPGAVVTLCRSLGGSISSPWPPFRDACQQPLGTVMTFSGDDRMVVYRDTDADGTFTRGADEVMDVLGRFGWRPAWEVWVDVGLRRCNLAPNSGESFYRHTDYFTEHRWTDYSHFGLAPDVDCRGNPL